MPKLFQTYIFAQWLLPAFVYIVNFQFTLYRHHTSKRYEAVTLAANETFVNLLKRLISDE